MKLILCPKCSDVVKFGMRKKRYCRCKKSWAKYIDEINGVYGGEGIPVCLGNSSLIDAIRNRPESGYGDNFQAWVPPAECSTIRKVGK